MVMPMKIKLRIKLTLCLFLCFPVLLAAEEISNRVLLERMDQRFAQMDQRFEQVDQRFEDMQRQLDQRFEAMQIQLDKRSYQMIFRPVTPAMAASTVSPTSSTISPIWISVTMNGGETITASPRVPSTLPPIG